VLLILVANLHLELRLCPRFFENYETTNSGAKGKLIQEKNLKSKIWWHSPFKWK
jgi:hypothetical protein